MLEKLAALEAQARKLEPDSQLRESVNAEAMHYAAGFINNIEDIPAYTKPDDEVKGVIGNFPSEEGEDITSLLGTLKMEVDSPGLNPASGGHLGYIPGGGIYFSSIGDYLAAVFNRYAGIHFASPGAVQMENGLIRWMAALAGFPASAAGNLSSGGSIANLTAIVTAREAAGIKARDIARTVIYLSNQAHHCIDKAIRIAGLGECIRRYIDLDENYRIKPEELKRQILEDKHNGLYPWLVIASAGTTDTGAVDPLDDIGAIAEANGLRYHIDAAYGGFFLLTEEGKEKLKGIEKADSLVMDPHKGLFLPYGVGVVLIRDGIKLQQAHYYQANYMQDALPADEEISPAELSPELTKHFRGLRMWLPLRMHGLAPFRAALEEKLLLARYFYEKVGDIPGFERGAFPELSVVTYRYVPEVGDADLLNQQLVEAIQKDGRVFISSTRLKGKFTLRLAVLSFRTHRATIDLLLQLLKEKSRELAGQEPGKTLPIL